jgi:hypothetical protein
MAQFPLNSSVNNVFPAGYKKGLLFNSGPSNYDPSMSLSGTTLDSSNYVNVFYQEYGGSGVYFQFVENQNLPAYQLKTPNLNVSGDPVEVAATQANMSLSDTNLGSSGSQIVLDSNGQPIIVSLLTAQTTSGNLTYYQSTTYPTITAPEGSIYQMGTSTTYINTANGWEELNPVVNPSIQPLPASPLVIGTPYQWTGQGLLFLAIPVTYFPQQNQEAYSELNISPDGNNWSVVDSYTLPLGLVSAQGEISYLHGLIPPNWYYRINFNFINAIVGAGSLAIVVSP